MGGVGDQHRGFGFLTIVQCEDGGYSGGFLVLNESGRPLEFHCTASVKPSRAQEILYGPTLAPYLFGEQIGQTLVKKAKSPLAMVFTDVAACHALRPQIEIPVLLVCDLDEFSTLPAGGAETARDALGAYRLSSEPAEAIPAAVQTVSAGESPEPRATVATAERRGSERGEIVAPGASQLATNQQPQPGSSLPSLRCDEPHVSTGPAAPWQKFTALEREFACCQDASADQQSLLDSLQGPFGGLDFGEPFLRIREAVKETINHGRL